jgi:hypothetical protein
MSFRGTKDDENSQARCLTYNQFNRENNLIGQASSLTREFSVDTIFQVNILIGRKYVTSLS